MTAELIDQPTRDLGFHRLRGIPEAMRLHQVLAEGLVQEHPPLLTVSSAWSSLPSPRTKLVGREQAVDEVVARMLSHRLVTLIGPGGTGKTHLALAAARHALTESPDGAFFVDLSAVNNPDEVAMAFATGTQFTPAASADITGQLVTAIGDRNVLVVVDNCEHVIDDVADVVDAVLTSCPNTRLLATSREAIAIDGENLIAVPGLPVSDAVELFLTRAHRRLDSPGPEERIAIEEICRRLDGLPLAIELAAARTNVMTPVDIRDRLDDRFTVLTGGRRRTRGRQATLVATIDWSYDLLDPSAQHALACLSVMPDRFDLELAAATIGCPEPTALELLDTLATHSLVDVGSGVVAATSYRLLETIRAYAADKLRGLGDERAARRRHAVNVLNRPVRDVPTSHESAVLAEDILAAHDWASSSVGDPELVDPLAIARIHVMHDRYLYDHEDEARQLLGRARPEDDAMLHYYLGLAASNLRGDMLGAARELQESADAAPDRPQSFAARVLRMPTLALFSAERFTDDEQALRSAIPTWRVDPHAFEAWVDYACGRREALFGRWDSALRWFHSGVERATPREWFGGFSSLIAAVLIDALRGSDTSDTTPRWAETQERRLTTGSWLREVAGGRSAERDLATARAILHASLGQHDAAIEQLLPRLDLRRSAVSYLIYDERVLTLALAALHHYRGDDANADLAMTKATGSVHYYAEFHDHLRAERAGIPVAERPDVFRQSALSRTDIRRLDAGRHEVNNRCLHALGVEP